MCTAASWLASIANFGAACEGSIAANLTSCATKSTFDCEIEGVDTGCFNGFPWWV